MQQVVVDHQRFQDSAEVPRKPSHVFPTPRSSERPVSEYILHNPSQRTDMERDQSQLNEICVETVSQMSKAPASRKLAGGRGEVLYQALVQRNANFKIGTVKKANVMILYQCIKLQTFRWLFPLDSSCRTI